MLMKKCLAILLSLALMCGCAVCAAEGKTEMGTLDVTEAFALQCVLPEGYSLNPSDVASDHYVASLIPADTNKPMMAISIRFNELLSDVGRLNDLDAAEIAEIEATFREEDEVEISYMETAYQTKLMVVREVRNGTDYVDFYTIYKGFEIEFVLTYGEEAAEKSVTEEQIRQAVAFLSELDFIQK